MLKLIFNLHILQRPSGIVKDTGFEPGATISRLEHFQGASTLNIKNVYLPPVSDERIYTVYSIYNVHIYKRI